MKLTETYNLSWKTEPMDVGSIRNVLPVLSGIILCMVALTVFQDVLESKRIGIDFNLDESILFKLVWFLFIPISVVLYKMLKRGRPESYSKASVYIVSAIAIHLLVLPVVGVFLSVLFFDGNYGLYKFFSYTLSHDLYKLVIVYTSFVLGYKYVSERAHIEDVTKCQPALETIVISNGRENTVVPVEDILQITSATPYVCVHVENKRYLHSDTLKAIYDLLDRSVFVRVHKSAVVNISKVRSFRSRLNGDYDLQMTNGELVRLSRNYAAGFKKHFKSSHQLNA